MSKTYYITEDGKRRKVTIERDRPGSKLFGIFIAICMVLGFMKVTFKDFQHSDWYKFLFPSVENGQIDPNEHGFEPWD